MPSCFFLGTGPGSPVPGRFNSSALLDTGGPRLLVDAGEPCAQRLAEHGHDVNSLDALLLTHGHSDHAGGLPMLLQAMHVAGRERPFTILMPRGLIAPLSAWLTACCLFPPLLGFELRLEAWEDGSLSPEGWRTAAFGELRIDALRNGHLDAARSRYNACGAADGEGGRPCFDSYSLRVRGLGWAAVFSSDIASVSDVIPLCDPPPDLLVCEMAHVGPDEILSLAARARAGRTVVNHVQPGFDEELAALLRRLPPEETPPSRPVAAADGDLVEFAKTFRWTPGQVPAS